MNDLHKKGAKGRNDPGKEKLDYGTNVRAVCAVEGEEKDVESGEAVAAEHVKCEADAKADEGVGDC